MFFSVGLDWTTLFCTVVCCVVTTCVYVYFTTCGVHMSSSLSNNDDHAHDHDQNTCTKPSLISHKTTQFWEKYHKQAASIVNDHDHDPRARDINISNQAPKTCNISKETRETEWLAEWSELKPFMLPILSQSENRLGIDRSQIKFLIIGNGLSKLPLNLYNEGFRNIIVTDVSQNAINIMERRYSADYPQIKWVIYDITCQYPADMEDKNKKDGVFNDENVDVSISQTKNIGTQKGLNVQLGLLNSNEFDFIIDKGCIDTISYRYSKQNNINLKYLRYAFHELSRLLNIGAKYLIVSPRKKMALLHLNMFEWSVFSMIIRNNNNNNNTKNINTYDDYNYNQTKFQQRQPNYAPMLYLHICTKLIKRKLFQLYKTPNQDMNNILPSLGLQLENKAKSKFKLNETNSIYTPSTSCSKRFEIVFVNNSNEWQKHVSVLMSCRNDQELIGYKYGKKNNFKIADLDLRIFNSNKVNKCFIINGFVQKIFNCGKKRIVYDILLPCDTNDQQDEKQLQYNKTDIDSQDCSQNNKQNFQLIQCVADRKYVNSLNVSNLRQQFAVNYVLRCHDQVRIYGVLACCQKFTDSDNDKLKCDVNARFNCICAHLIELICWH